MIEVEFHMNGVGKLNFQSFKMMVTHNMVTGLPNTISPDGVCGGCMLEKHHQEPFDSGKSWVAQE